MWYCVHVMMRVVTANSDNDPIAIWENVYLVRADDDRAAMARAKEIGAAHEGDAGGTLVWDGQPARLEYAGVRKMIKPDEEELADGVELTYNEFIVARYADVGQLLRGERTSVEIVE